MVGFISVIMEFFLALQLRQYELNSTASQRSFERSWSLWADYLGGRGHLPPNLIEAFHIVLEHNRRFVHFVTVHKSDGRLDRHQHRTLQFISGCMIKS